MNEKLFNIVKIVVPVLSVGVTIASKLISDKEFDMKVAEKVNEALAKANGEA